MSAIDNLNTNISLLDTAVTAAVNRIAAPGVPEAQVQAAADAVASETARLNAATGS